MTLNLQEDREQFKSSLQEISNCMTRIEAERDLIKDTVKSLVDQYDLPKKIVNKLARVYHKQNFTEEVEINEQFEEIYQEISMVQTKAATN